jgi:hypothetical protein
MLNSLTPSYAHVVLICPHMLMTFFYVNTRGLPERTEARRRFAEDSVDLKDTKGLESVSKEREEQAEAEVDEKS